MNFPFDNPLINPEFTQKTFEELKHKNDKALQHKFSGQIKGNFLIAIKDIVSNTLLSEIAKYYDLRMTDEKIVSNNLESVDYDICRHIVGIHRSNLLFETIEKRKQLEGDSEYQEKLIQLVISQIKLRQYGSMHFRQHPIMRGDSFIFYPVPYRLFVLCIKMLELLNTEKARTISYYHLITTIVNKGLSALALLEDNFLDNAYPICRGVIELYVKLLLLANKPEAISQYNKFAKYELDKSCISQTYSDEFNSLYASRINQKHYDKIDFMHYGWVDSICDYHNVIKTKPYSINGIIQYLYSLYDDEGNLFLSNLERLFKMCHGYTHGNIGCAIYPILHYFEISMMLYGTLSHTYRMLCDILQQDEKINGIDVLAELDETYKQLEIQYENRTTENFKYYYNFQYKI